MTMPSVHVYGPPGAHSRRPAPVRHTHPPHLRVVAPPPARALRLRFGLDVIAMLAAGLIGLLALNTASAQSAFREHALQAQVAVLTDRAQALQVALDEQAAPSALASRAEQLGMRPSTVAHYLQLPPGALGATTVAAPPGTPRCHARQPARASCAATR